jgi:hypothetical protein
MNEINDYQVLMSPLLDEKFQKIENDINEIKMEYKNANKKYDTIIQLLNDNINLQSNLLKEYYKKSDENIKLLQENSKIYMNALDKIYETDTKELKPILQNLYENNDKLSYNMSVPYFNDRLMNRMWRTTYNHRFNNMTGGMRS